MRTCTRILLVLGLFLFSAGGHAQELQPEQDRDWSPYYLKTQFAGDVGLVSVGIGKQSFSQRLETDLSLGYLPKSVGGDHIFTLALKSTLLPFKPVKVGPVDWHAFTTGMQLGYIFGKEYFASEKYLSRYPNSYYRFSTAFHLYLFAGGQVNFTRIEKLNRFKVYYEAGTMAKYLVSYVQNPKYLSPGKIFHLAIGAKMHL
ncbi:hypothetical protein EFA69_02715 [Rufibacter immobilis]|uniref:Outer membrane protein beta-barrel domain-containing protein n=1 Tax=Rufibacter immobilis TaxID=1348778 RepID=A0A3M9N5I6_9BACT|nr:hypothetical protein [Rufibacter immobilis]RNI32258.1 hypothetical protein EFA69_02715 [Rufibacter immobilis]